MGVSLINPLFESTDEIRHYRYIRYLVLERALPIQGREVIRTQSHHPPLYYALSALVSGWPPTSHTAQYEHPLNPFWGYRNWEPGVDNKLQYLHTPAESLPRADEFFPAYLARWLNVLFGALTLFCAYQLGLRVWDDAGVALATAFMVAFNAQFVYLSAAMNNDILAALLGTFVLWLCVMFLQRETPGWRWLLALGLALGIAALAKVHLLIMGAVIALTLLLKVLPLLSGPRSERDLRSAATQWLLGMGCVLLAGALVSGWWFWRNVQLYGDPLGMTALNELWGGRPAAGNWWALRQGLPYLWASLWGRFGYGQIPLPDVVYGGLLVFCLVGFLGYLRRGETVLPWAEMTLLGTTVLLFTIVVSYYILIQPAGAMGRFLFPALPAFAALIAGGWARWLRHGALTAWLMGLSLGAVLCYALGGVLWPAVRPPATATPPFPGEPISIQVGDVARILSLDVQPARVQPGEPLFVTLTWQPLHRTETPHSVFVHLVDEAGVLLAQRDTWPGLGRAPTVSWRVGQKFVDVYRLDLPETAYAPNQAHVQVGLYTPEGGRLPLFGAEGTPQGDALFVDTINIEPRPGPWPNAMSANFNDEITLRGYTLEPRQLAAGETLTLTLYWQAQQPPRYPYFVFAQVLDSAYNVWGSRDGYGPEWRADEEILVDVRRITLLPDTPPGSYPLQVGLFYGETGRLPVLAPGGDYYLDERVLLGPIRVGE